MKTIIIFSFMISELKLTGTELLIYAFFYSFSQFGLTCFVKPEKIALNLGISRSSVFRAINSLKIKNLITFNERGYITNNHDLKNKESSDELERMIKIAKTPWLDD